MCKSCQTSHALLPPDENLQDDWHERGLLAHPLCVTSCFSQHGRQAGIVTASQAYLVGDVIYDLASYVVTALRSLPGYVLWCDDGIDTILQWGTFGILKVRGMRVPGDFSAVARAGVWDHSVKEQFELLSKKLESATTVIADIKRELDLLKQRCMEEPPLKRTRVTADGEEEDDNEEKVAEGEDKEEDGDIEQYLRDRQTFKLRTSSRSRRTYSIFGQPDNCRRLAL